MASAATDLIWQAPALSVILIMSATGYAGLMAMSRFRAYRWGAPLAYGCYAMLTLSTLLLSLCLGLEGHWHLITGTMLIGYWFLPRGIMALCQQSHVL